MLPGQAFDVRPASGPVCEDAEAEVRDLVRVHARDGEDEALLLAALGLEEA